MKDKELEKLKTNNKKLKKNIFEKTTRICIVLSIIFVVVWAGIYFINYRLDSYSEILSGRNEEIQFQKKTEISALICGINGFLTDTIIYVKANLETGKISYISIPRDTYITNNYAVGHKINSIYRKVNIEPLVAEVQELIDVEIDYYLVVDADIVIDLVDSIGGVEFNVPMRMKYDDPTQDLHIDLEEGMQVLDGDKAEQLIRFRKGNDGSGYREGDIQRTKVQQDFIKAFLNQAAKAENILKADEIISIALNNTDTNITIREALAYITDIPKLDLPNIFSCTAPGTAPYIDGISYFVLNEKETKKIIEENF